MLQMKQKTNGNTKTTVLPGIISVMRSFHLWEERYNEKTTWKILVWKYISARAICRSTSPYKTIATANRKEQNKPF